MTLKNHVAAISRLFGINVAPRKLMWLGYIYIPIGVWLDIANHDAQPVATCSQVLGISPPPPSVCPGCLGSVACCIYIISLPWLVWNSFHSCGCNYLVFWKCLTQMIGRIRRSLLCVHFLLRHENSSRASSWVCVTGHWLYQLSDVPCGLGRPSCRGVVRPYAVFRNEKSAQS